MAPATKYGGKMVVCQPGTIAIEKSKLTTVWTESTKGVARPASKHSRKGVRITPVRIKAHDSAHTTKLTFKATGLPSGLKISKGGVIYGKPKATGSYRVKVYATDARGMTGSAKLRWTVLG